MQNSFTKKILTASIGVLALLVLLNAVQFSLLSNQILASNETAVKVNASGRQRYLTQRIIALTGDLLYGQLEGGDSAMLLSEINEEIAEIEEIHAALLVGNPERSISGSMSPAVERVYFSTPYNLDAQLSHFLSEIKDATTTGKAPPIEDRAHFLEEYTLLIPALEELVSVIQNDHKIANQALSRTVVYLLASNVIVMALAATYLILPSMRRIEGDVVLLRKESARSKEAQLRFKSLFDGHPDATVIVSGDGKISLANSQARAVLGYKSNELAGVSLEKLIPRSALRKHNLHMDTFFRNPQVRKMALDGREVYAVRKDGEEFPAEISLSPIIVGENISVAASIHDISDRKNFERERATILAISASLRRAEAAEEIYPLILDEIVDALALEGSALILNDISAEKNIVELATGVWDKLTGALLDVDEGVASVVMKSGEQLIEKDSENRHPNHTHKDSMSEVEAIATLPMKTGKNILGVLVAGRQKKFSDQDVSLLASVANMSANAIKRIKLFEQTRRQLQQLNSLREIDYAISSNMNFDEILHVLLNMVTNQLGIDASTVYLFNAKKQELKLAHAHGLREPKRLDSSLDLDNSLAAEVIMTGQMVHIGNLEQRNLTSGFNDFLEAEEFQYYAGAPLKIKGQVKGILEIFHRGQLNPDREWLDFYETLASHATIAIQEAESVSKLRNAKSELEIAYDATLLGWADALDMRDNETAGHTKRVTDLTLDLAIAFGITEKEQLGHIARGATLHDIGKISVPDSILLKPGKLTDDEWIQMKMHPEYAYGFLRTIKYLKASIDIPRYHHEKWDGSGYPEGLKGEEIPIAARIFALVDVWDALRSNRPYRKAWSRKRTIAHILDQSGKHFDPKITKTFLELLNSSSVDRV